MTLARLVRAAGLRWPVEETFEFSKVTFGLDQCQARLHTAIIRHTVLVMTALAICAIAAARLTTRTDTQAPPPNPPDQRQGNCVVGQHGVELQLCGTSGLCGGEGSG